MVVEFSIKLSFAAGSGFPYRRDAMSPRTHAAANSAYTGATLTGNSVIVWERL
jgi:hypothetical protein